MYGQLAAQLKYVKVKRNDTPRGTLWYRVVWRRVCGAKSKIM